MISIISISYKDPLGLYNTIQSLTALLDFHVEWEHIIVDSSPELNTQVIESLPRNWPLKYITTPPEGIYKAFNVGLSNVSGSHVWFLNGGDELTSAISLKTAMCFFLEDPKLQLLCCGVSLFRDKKYLYSCIPKKTFLKNILGSCKLSHPGMIYSVEVFERIGAFLTDYRIAADYEHHFRCYINKINTKCDSLILANFDMSGLSSNFFYSMKEAWKITIQLRSKIPFHIWLIQVNLMSIESVRLLLISIARFTKLNLIFQSVWHSWKRR